MRRVILAVLLTCSIATPQIIRRRPLTAVATPTSLSNLVFWYKTDAGTNCSSNTCAVTSWNDQSGNANNLTCTGTTFATSSVNGLPAILGSASASCTFTSNPDISAAFTIFAVVKSTTADQVIISGPANSFTWYSAGNAKEQSAERTDDVSIGDGSTAADTAYHQINAAYNNTTMNFRLGRATDGTLTPGIAALSGAENHLFTHGVASGLNYQGNLAELFAFTRVLTGPEITQMETYLNSRYGL